LRQESQVIISSANELSFVAASNQRKETFFTPLPLQSANNCDYATTQIVIMILHIFSFRSIDDHGEKREKEKNSYYSHSRVFFSRQTVGNVMKVSCAVYVIIFVQADFKRVQAFCCTFLLIFG
jgi:hypothetical protein